MEQHFDTTENEDTITLDSKAGLELFAEHVDQLREEVELLQATYHNRYETIPPEFYTAGECYRQLRTLVMTALEELFTGDQVSDKVVDELQSAYNALSDARDQMLLLTTVGEEVSEVLDAIDVNDTDTQTEVAFPELPIVEESVPSPFYSVATMPTPTAPAPKSNSQSVSKFAAHAKKGESLFKKKEAAHRPLELVTPEILTNPKYKKVIEHYFTSPAVFEAKLIREIEKRERPSKLDAFLGVTHQSAFHTFLKDLPLSEIAMLEEESFGVMRERVSALHIEYTIYVEWMKDLPIMHHLVRPHAAMTFSELYVRAELEILCEQFFADR